MLFSKFAGLFLLCFTIIVAACPISERAIESDGLEVFIAPTLFKLDLSPVSPTYRLAPLSGMVKLTLIARYVGR